jgi:hypothetical protein
MPGNSADLAYSRRESGRAAGSLMTIFSANLASGLLFIDVAVEGSVTSLSAELTFASLLISAVASKVALSTALLADSSTLIGTSWSLVTSLAAEWA